MKLTIRKILIMTAMIPLMATAVTMTCGALYEVKESLYENQELAVRTAARGFTGDIRAYGDLGIDITVFEGDVRTESSIAGSIGTKASAVVTEEVLKGGHEYISRDVDVNGQSYLGYYVPTENGMLFAGKSNESIMDTLKSVVKILVTMCIISVILFTAIVIYVSGLIGRLLKGSAEGLGIISDGNLTETEIFRRKALTTELADINSAALKMTDNIKKVVGDTARVGTTLTETSGEVNTTAETVLNATNEISLAIEEIANGATDQSNSVQNMAAGLAEISNDMNEAGNNIADMTDCAENMKNSSTEMKKRIDESISGMEKMNAGIGVISRQLKKTDELFGDVRKFIEIINDIADRTKLLSINAAIEAAHAGEAGKGFTVVAENIKSMSEDTTGQAKEISSIIEGLVKDFDACMDSIGSIVADNAEQKRNMEYVSEAFDTLNENIRKTAGRIAEVDGHIKNVTGKCTAAATEAEEMTAIAENAAAATEEITAGIQEVNATLHNLEGKAGELARTAVMLEDEISFFRV